MTDPSSQWVAELFADLGRELVGAGSDTTEVFKVLVRRSVELIAAADWASVTRLTTSSGFETLAATDVVARQLDAIQYEVGHGPCVDAVGAGESGLYLTGELASDPRWPEFGPRAATGGAHSMLSSRFYLENDDLIAGLNLYAGAPNAFDSSHVATMTVIATHGGLALAAARERGRVDNLHRALQSNRRIGIAIGILMALRKVTDEQAFDLLRVASQNSHRKLADVAEDVVRTGTTNLPSIEG